MNALEFLSIRPAPGATPQLRSPLERALGAEFEDLSLARAKFEVRGDLAGLTDAIAITPTRGLVVVPIDEGEAVEKRLRASGATVIDVTGALAGVRIERADAVTLLRRLTDLDLERLPAVGAVARVPAVVRGGGNAFELFWPQEYGHYLATVIVDTAAGLS